MRFDRKDAHGQPDGLYLVVKDKLTDGELEDWGEWIEWGKGVPKARGSCLRGAIRAGIVLETSDPVVANLLAITTNSRDERVIENAIRLHESAEVVQWFGARLVSLYNRYTVFDPN